MRGEFVVELVEFCLELIKLKTPNIMGAVDKLIAIIKLEYEHDKEE